MPGLFMLWSMHEQPMLYKHAVAASIQAARAESVAPKLSAAYLVCDAAQ
jgi:hypothetical protein